MADETKGTAEAAATNLARDVTAAKRLSSLDAYRGFVMLAMVSGGLGFGAVARKLPDSTLWQFLAHQVSHVEWLGCTFWDLIQPSFIFMVGVAMPFSHASRLARGQSRTRLHLHAVFRAIVLVSLGIFLRSNGRQFTNFTFEDVVTQIGLGYLVVHFLVGHGIKVQALALGIILGGYWLAFLLYPLPAAGFDYAAVGVGSDWKHLEGFFAHWDKNSNLAAAFDQWFLNLFPRPQEFVYNGGGYQTLSFVPSMATMIFGLLSGELLRGARLPGAKAARLLVGGAACLLLGEILGHTVCPVVKRIWTPSWAVYSTGWTLLLLAAFYVVIEIWGWRRWAFPFVVVGMNSIAMYCMAQLSKGWVIKTMKTHFGPDTFSGLYGPIVQSVAALLALWLVCLWLYRRRIFLRI